MEERDKLDTTSGVVSVGTASAAEVTEPVKKRRGRPPKNGGAPRSGVTPKSAVDAKMGSSRKRKRDDEEEEVVCFICFDGGNLVVCDKRYVNLPLCFSEERSERRAQLFLSLPDLLLISILIMRLKSEKESCLCKFV